MTCLIEGSRILARICMYMGLMYMVLSAKSELRSKSCIGIPKECEEVGVSICNPIMRAERLNKAQTDLNIVVGLCVGHDSLFYKYSNAFCTTAITEDRVLGHNPAAACMVHPATMLGY